MEHIAEADSYRVDNTHEVYSKKLAKLENSCRLTVRKLRIESTWLAAKSAEHCDIVNNEDFLLENSDLWERSLSMADEIELGFYKISDLNSALGRLKRDIASTKEHLAWVVEARSVHAGAKVASSDEATIVVG
jgi:hypothetical protein